MVTQAQFNADTYVRREVITTELDWLGDEICRRTGRPRTAAGTKGDRNHLRGAHRSQEFIRRSALCTNRTYTVQSGLTAEQERYIGGFDFTPGDVEKMIAQSRRLMAAVKGGHLEEVREVYCNVDGDRVVDGFDNVRNRAATSDSSHLWHWHLTIDRRRLTDRRLMERILAVALAETEDDMGFLDEKNTQTGRTGAQMITDLWWANFKGNAVDVEQAALKRVEATLAAIAADPGNDVVLGTEQVTQLAGLLAPLLPTANQVAAAVAAREAAADRARADALTAEPS